MNEAGIKSVPGLRSPRAEVEGLVYFGRMVDKVRLAQAGKLPAAYLENLGKGFDASCCEFLGVSYEKLRDRVCQGGSDRELLDWCQSQGRKRDSKDLVFWNGYMSKRGWRDDLSDRLVFRKKESGWEGREEIQTFFDYIEADEGLS